MELKSKIFQKNTLMVSDMSSIFFSRVIDYSKFDCNHAGAQKIWTSWNDSSGGKKKEILGKSGRVIPSYLDYAQHVAKESMFNTPPVFAVYASLLTLQWLENNGGIAAAEERNIAKAKLL